VAIRYSSSFGNTIPWSDTDWQFALAANAVLSFTLPGDFTYKYTLLFGLRHDSNLFVGYNVSPTVPGGGMSTNVQGVEFITPDSQRYAQGGDVIYLVTPDTTAYVGVSVRSIPN
jgi:hypothetical protein